MITKDVFFGFIDQALISLTHLVIGVYFIQFAPKSDYGIYSMAFAIILFINGLNNALITTQMTVNAADYPPLHKKAYCCKMLSAQNIVLSPFIISSLIFTWILKLIGSLNISISLFITIVIFTVPCVLLHDFFRRYFFLNFNPRFVLLLDSIRTALLILLIYFFHVSEIFNNFHSMVMFCYGFSAVLVGYIGLRAAHIFEMVNPTHAIKAFLIGWENGQWASLGVLLTWLQNQSYSFILAGFCGVTAVADASAARLFFAPVAILTTSFTKIYMPRLAVMRNDGEFLNIQHKAKYIFIIMISIVAAYSIIIYSLKATVLDQLLPAKYHHIGSFIVAWMFFFVFQSARSNSSLMLQVMKEFKQITQYSFLTGPCVLILCVVFIYYYGIIGSIVSMAFGELALAIVLWRAFKRVIER